MTTTDRVADQGSGSGSGLHPILGWVASVSAALDRVTGTPAWSMTLDEQRRALVDLAVLGARSVELRLRVLASAEANQVGEETGAASTAAWVAHQTRQTQQSASADLRLATALDAGFEATRTGMAAGTVNLAQAQVIVAAVGALSEDIGTEQRHEAEAYLVERTSLFDAKRLRLLGRRLFEVIDPAKTSIARDCT